MWGKRSAIFRYMVYGALFGLAFPVLSTLGDLYMQQLPLTLENLLQVQRSTVLHWVIDTAPFFLGLFASFAGRRQDQLACLNEILRQKVEERDQAIDRLEALQAGLEQRVVAERGQREQAQHLVQSEQEQRGDLQRILLQVRKAASNLSGAVAEISAAVTQQASGASGQSTSGSVRSSFPAKSSRTP